MSLVEIQWDPTQRQVRQFAAVSVVALPLLGWLWTHSQTVASVAGCVGAVLAILAWAAPVAVRPVMIGLSLITAPIGIVVGELTMLVIYFLVVAPIGLAVRCFGRSSVTHGPDPSRASYWDDAHEAGYNRETKEPEQNYRMY